MEKKLDKIIGTLGTVAAMVITMDMSVEMLRKANELVSQVSSGLGELIRELEGEG